MARALLPLLLLVPTLAFADVPPDDGEGCKCDVANPAAAIAPALWVALALWARRRR